MTHSDSLVLLALLLSLLFLVLSNSFLSLPVRILLRQSSNLIQCLLFFFRRPRPRGSANSFKYWRSAVTSYCAHY
jgi:hypothetical protein